MISQYTPRFLTTAINEIKPVKSRIRNLVFKQSRETLAEYTDFEIVTGTRKLARFVARGREALVREKEGRKIVTFKIPSIREKTPFRAADVLRNTGRGSGAPYVGSQADLKSALDKEVLFQLAEFRSMLDRTKEWLCSQAVTGSIAITLDDGDLAVDFGFPAANKPVLAGAEKWDSGAAELDIPKQLRQWKRRIIQGSGYTPTDVMLGSSAADAFLSDAKVLKLLDANNVRAGVIDLNSPDGEYLGMFSGLRFWSNDEQYVDDSGTAQSYLSAGAVIMTAESAPNTFYHGPVDDIDANFGTFEFFSKQFETKDPSVRWLLVATAPLPIVGNANSIIYATVL